MKKSKKATSIAEAMIVMLIVVTGVTGMYSIYGESIQFSNFTKNKIQAIQMASQGIEAFTNIRDTNWLVFSGDYDNCWNTLNYNSNCIGATNTGHTIINNESYIIYTNIDNKWFLSKKTTNTFGSGTYIDDFKVGLNNGIYTQSGITVDIKTKFTREIKIKYLTMDGANGDENEQKIKIISLVQWIDSSSESVHKVQLEQILTNWKK